ncbi:MAG TPA: pilus assembly protein N-terminal domain-containing protein [Pirellulales bacterium]|jgi:pilus assembly protein CpaC|nr:pilus assembly protein N-terminal domain-containing protein [Pirellulales bacterium]
MPPAPAFGAIQTPGPIQTPGAFQTPGVTQTPGAIQSPAADPQHSNDLSIPSGFAPVANDLIHHIQGPSERMEMTVNASRILTLDQNIPRAQVNNREILELTALSPNEIQVLAKKAGVTQINLWNEKGQIYTVDCVVSGDARELTELLRAEFPAANLRVRPMASSVLLTGFVDRADQISQIIQIAQDYYPKVVPNIQVGGVQQIMLHVKVAEVSRTKLRELGFDFASVNGGSFLASSISNLLAPGTVAGTAAPSALGDTVRFGLVKNNTAFFGFLDALRKEDLLKVLSDPTLVTVSGRPAQFKVGGEIPYPANSTLNGVSVAYKDTGITVDFVPIVLGNGNIRLEVRPIDRELDPTQSFEIAPGVESPAFTLRQVDTGVEMRAGQTLAIAGLVQKRLNAEKQEIPWLGEMPYVGAAFRHVKQTEEEVELLFLVTPEIVQALDPCEVPQCFPGMHTDVPSDCGLYFKGYNEVPSKGPCGPYGCNPACGSGDLREGPGYGPEGAPFMMGPMPGGIVPASPEPIPSPPPPARPTSSGYAPGSGNTTSNSMNQTSRIARLPNAVPPAVASPPSATPSVSSSTDNRYKPPTVQNQYPANGAIPSGGSPGFIGPVGYDVLN